MTIKSPINTSNNPLSLTVNVNGLPIKDYYPLVSVNAKHEVNRISVAEIVFLDGSAAEADFPISAGDDFKPGNVVEILAGYEASESIFKGTVVKQSIRIDMDNPPVLIITCKHQAKLTFNTNKTTKPVLRVAYGESIVALDAEMDAQKHPAAITGIVTFRGSADAIPGKFIELAGLGKRFNGNAFIAGVEHNIMDGDWKTIVSFGLRDDI